jgi:hypothetical protein
MFQLIEKNGMIKGVHSQADLEYMLKFGWKKRNVQSAEQTVHAAAQTVELPDIPTFTKRKPGRPKK